MTPFARLAAGPGRPGRGLAAWCGHPARRPAARAGQTPPPTVAALPSPAASPTPSPEYRVGPGDVLEVEVFGNPELSRTPTVQTNGMVALPLLGEVPVAGLTLAEVKAELTALLLRDYLVNPQVDVRVKEYQSQFVTLLGEMSTPGPPARCAAGRPASSTCWWRRAASPRAPPARSWSAAPTAPSRTAPGRCASSSERPNLTPEEERRLQVPLRAGDVITASPKYYVTVEGEVMRPGRYVLDTALTVSGAISAAGGLTRFGSQQVKVRRIDGPTGRVQIFDVDLKAVRKGAKPDPPLQANDTDLGLAPHSLGMDARGDAHASRRARRGGSRRPLLRRHPVARPQDHARRHPGRPGPRLVRRPPADARVPRHGHAADRAAHARCSWAWPTPSWAAGTSGRTPTSTTRSSGS